MKNKLFLVMAIISITFVSNAQETKPTIAAVNLHVPSNAATTYMGIWDYE